MKFLWWINFCVFHELETVKLNIMCISMWHAHYAILNCQKIKIEKKSLCGNLSDFVKYCPCEIFNTYGRLA